MAEKMEAIKTQQANVETFPASVAMVALSTGSRSNGRLVIFRVWGGFIGRTNQKPHHGISVFHQFRF